MIEKEELTHEEEASLKVTDRRKFNPDGSLRDGVVLEPEPPKSEPEPMAAPDSNILSSDGLLPDNNEAGTLDIGEEEAGDSLFEDDNPASFINFLSTLVTNAAASLGAMPHPVTGQKSVDLDTGKYWIDVLQMIHEKTKNNLNPQEQHLLASILSDLKLQYVSLARESEQKLKAQAARKFSSKDILGGD